MHEINCIATQLLVLKIGTEFLFVVYDFNKKKHHNREPSCLRRDVTLHINDYV